MLPRRVWPEYEWLLLHFALPGCGDSYWGGMGCMRLCMRRGEHQSLWEKGGKKKGGGNRERKRTGACEEKEGGSFRQRSRTTALTLQSFFCFSEETVFSSPCLSVLLAPSSFAAWPWPQWTPWSPCPPREEERNAEAEEWETRRGDTAHFASLMRVWKLINCCQNRGGSAERCSEWGAGRE